MILLRMCGLDKIFFAVGPVRLSHALRHVDPTSSPSFPNPLMSCGVSFKALCSNWGVYDDYVRVVDLLTATGP